MIKVQIIQPVLPPYRVSFFESLFLIKELEVSFYSGIGPYDVSNLSDQYDTSHDFDEYFFGSLLWQRNLDLDKGLKKGDVLVVCGNPRFISNYPLIFKAKIKGISIVWWGHGWSSGRFGFLSKVRIKIMRIADVILLYSDKEVNEYKRMGYFDHNIFSINNTIDTDKIKKRIGEVTKKELMIFTQENGIYQKKIILFCGRIIEKSSLNVLIKALSMKGASFDSSILVVIGKGDQEDNLKEYANKLNVQDRIVWVGELYDEKRLSYWFMNAYCFVYPGSIGLSLLHAFSYGVPVITHGNWKNHMPEFSALRDGQNGLLFDEGSSQSLSEVLSNFLDNENQRKILSVCAMNTAHKEYSFAIMLNRFISTIKFASNLKNK
jgi:glycosyltransferase involved in cell wall biosynthesis